MNEQSRERLGEFIKDLRGETSLRDFAKKIGVSHQAVAKWEKADAVPTIDALLVIARLSGMSVDEILFHVGAPGERVVIPQSSISGMLRAMESMSKEDLRTLITAGVEKLTG